MLFQAKVIIKPAPGACSPIRSAAGIALRELHDQGAFNPEYRIAAKVRAIRRVELRDECLVTLSRDHEMDMRGPEGMAPRRVQHLAHRTVRRDRVLGRHDRPEGEATL